MQVLYSRCKYEIGQLRPLENKRKAAEPSPPTMKKFGGQHDHRPASRAVFDRLGAQSPSTSVGHKDEAAPRPVKTFKPPVVRDDRWYHAQPGGSAQPLTKTQLRRMQRQVQQARIQTAQVEGSKRQKKMATADEPPSMRVSLTSTTEGNPLFRPTVEASDPPKIKASTDGTPGTARPMVEGPDDPFFGHEAEDDPTLGISDEEYEGILGTVEEKTLARGGREVQEKAGGENQQEPKQASMNMVLVLPSEFSALGGQTNGLDNDVAEEQLDQRQKMKEELLVVAFNEVIPRDEPNKDRHLKPLFISAHVEGLPMSKVFVDCGATVNILPYSLMRKLDKSREDLIPSDVVMSSFVGDKSKTIRVLPLKITMADQTRVAAFYVVESSVDYNILLGRDWIHQSGCKPSSLFQLLFFWDGQRVSIHSADEKPFETNAVQARI
ncbi:unnamed protein product [Prunus brigantina]